MINGAYAGTINGEGDLKCGSRLPKCVRERERKRERESERERERERVSEGKDEERARAQRDARV